MREVLVINSSVSGEASVTRKLVAETVERLRAADPAVHVNERDLGTAPIPHLLPETVAGIREVATTDEERAAAALSDTLIAEVQAADVLVIGAPMYNFSIASSLRVWFDLILRPRVTFAYGENGVEGKITGVKAVVVQARGGVYTEGPAKAIDFQEPYLRQLLGFIGITDVAFIHAEKIGYGPEARQAAIAHASSQIEEVTARIIAGKPAGASNGGAGAPEPEPDYAAVLGANLVRVFSEKDASRRLEAIRAIYAEDALLQEPDRSVQGHDAIAAAVSELIDSMPPDFTFSAIRPPLGHHGLGRLQWRAGPPDGPTAVTGTDVVHVEHGRIKSIHVFLDQPGS